MRDFFSNGRDFYDSSPRWGFITERLLACLRPRHGQPQLWTASGPGSPYSDNGVGSYSFVSGSRWGGPMYRFNNGEGAGLGTSKSIVVNFKPPWGQYVGLPNSDWTIAIVVRLGPNTSAYEKIAARFDIGNYPSNVNYQFLWYNAYQFRCRRYIALTAKTVSISHPVGNQWNKWCGMVMTSHWEPSSVRTFYAGMCDGSFFGAKSDDAATPLARPGSLYLSAWNAKAAQGWNGEVGGFVFTRGAWTELQARQWILNPFAWAYDWGQTIRPVDACLTADATTMTACEADVEITTALESDACITPALEADAKICPEDAP